MGDHKSGPKTCRSTKRRGTAGNAVGQGRLATNSDRSDRCTGHCTFPVCNPARLSRSVGICYVSGRGRKLELVSLLRHQALLQGQVTPSTSRLQFGSGLFFYSDYCSFMYSFIQSLKSSPISGCFKPNSTAVFIYSNLLPVS